MLGARVAAAAFAAADAGGRLTMTIAEAQREIRTRLSGGFYGFFIFPLTELLVRTVGSRMTLSRENTLPQLGMQVTFVLPLSMPLLLPIWRFRPTWFYPAMMILLGREGDRALRIASGSA
jgi:hypothetical protein